MCLGVAASGDCRVRAGFLPRQGFARELACVAQVEERGGKNGFGIFVVRLAIRTHFRQVVFFNGLFPRVGVN